VLDYIEGGGGGGVPGSEPPTILTMSPLSGAVGSPDVTITVTGTGFAQGSAIMWDGAALATTFTDATTLSATAPVSQSTAEGQAEVRVANGAEESNPVYFTFTAAELGPAPSITSLNPPEVLVGAAPIMLSVVGTNFTATSIVRVNATDQATTFVDAATLTVEVPTQGTMGAAAITVANDDGQVSNEVTFSIQNPPPPARGAA
jgi:hypothetical protein